MNTHAIGIDFGTSKTLVSHINPQTGHPETIRLGRGGDLIPTTIFIDSAGRFSFGDDADDMIEDISGTYLRGVKMQLGSDTPVHMYLASNGDCRQLTAKDLVREYLLYIRQQVEKLVYQGESVTRATITRPVNFSPAQCQELQQAAIAAGFKHVEFTTEPEAAGLAYCRLNAAHAFARNALVVDWGGGTLDFALVTRSHDSVRTHGHLTDGDMEMGGEKFDEILWNYAVESLKSHGVTTLNPVSQLPRVRRSKELLSSRQEVILRLSQENGACPPLALSRETFNLMIAAYIDKAAQKLHSLLSRIPSEHQPEMLLLVGGSSQIPLIKEKLEEACGLPAYMWHYSREAVALGAALWSYVPPTPEEKIQHERNKARIELNRRGIEPDEYDTNLLRAAGKGDIAFIQLLLSAGTDINATGNNLETALYEAVYSGNMECIVFLTEINDIDINKADNTGCTPLILAAASGNTQCVDLLLSKPDIKVNQTDNHGRSALFVACQTGHAECVKKLVSAKGINVNLQTENKLSPLHIATYLCHSECVRELLAAPHIQVNLPEESGGTPLILLMMPNEETKQQNKLECLRTLLQCAEVNINATAYNGNTPLVIAAMSGYHLLVRELCKTQHIDINKKGNNDTTALGAAILANHVKCVSELLQAPAINVNLKCNDCTPLYIAEQMGHNECADLLRAKLNSEKQAHQQQPTPSQPQRRPSGSDLAGCSSEFAGCLKWIAWGFLLHLPMWLMKSCD
ncbi:MAG: hypothetical protein E7032_03215 [Akkermansiaceae bacterium]|nr:hypothetical protein [Akkermansiaceae bacterium]